MAADLLDRILEAARVGETTDWEFKSGKGGFPGSFWQTYCAMANSEGGTIVLGAREDEGKVRLDVLGADQVGAYQKILWDGLNNPATVSRNLLALDDARVVEVAGSSRLAVRVPRATRAQRPIYHGPNPLTQTWRRQHEGDYRCSEDEVRRMFADAEPTARDQRVLVGFSLDDLDPATLEQYRRRVAVTRADHPWLHLGDRELLEKLGGWRKERDSTREGLTRAALLMFGKDQPLRDPEAGLKYFVDYREKLDPSTRWNDRIYPDGTWEPNLFQFYSRVWPKLAAGIPTPFRLEGDQRRDVTPTHEALREALVNTLIHADYAGAGGIVVERYPDRFFLSNPGTLLVSLEQYQTGGVSECRNPALQQMFLLIGGGEKAGSGADKIRAGWRLQHWRAPKIEVFGQPDRVGLTLPTVGLIPEETLHRLRGGSGARSRGCRRPSFRHWPPPISRVRCRTPGCRRCSRITPWTSRGCSAACASEGCSSRTAAGDGRPTASEEAARRRSSKGSGGGPGGVRSCPWDS
jgi:predicted HTH transcriptional regulator